MLANNSLCLTRMYSHSSFFIPIHPSFHFISLIRSPARCADYLQVDALAAVPESLFEAPSGMPCHANDQPFGPTHTSGAVRADRKIFASHAHVFNFPCIANSF